MQARTAAGSAMRSMAAAMSLLALSSGSIAQPPCPAVPGATSGLLPLSVAETPDLRPTWKVVGFFQSRALAQLKPAERPRLEFRTPDGTLFASAVIEPSDTVLTRFAYELLARRLPNGQVQIAAVKEAAYDNLVGFYALPSSAPAEAVAMVVMPSLGVNAGAGVPYVGRLGGHVRARPMVIMEPVSGGDRDFNEWVVRPNC